MSSDDDEKKKLYEFDGSYLKELNKIRKEFNLVEFNETTDSDDVKILDGEFLNESDREKDVNLEKSRVKKRTKLKKNQKKDGNSQTTTKINKIKTNTNEVGTKLENKQKQIISKTKTKDNQLQIDLSFMQIEDAELYRCDNNDMHKLNRIRKELNLPEFAIEENDFSDETENLFGIKTISTKIKRNLLESCNAENLSLERTVTYESHLLQVNNEKEVFENFLKQELEKSLLEIKEIKTECEEPECRLNKSVHVSTTKKINLNIKIPTKEFLKFEKEKNLIQEMKVDGCEDIDMKLNNLDTVLNFSQSEDASNIKSETNLKFSDNFKDISVNLEETNNAKTKNLILSTSDNFVKVKKVIDSETQCTSKIVSKPEIEDKSIVKVVEYKKHVNLPERINLSVRNIIKKSKVYPEKVKEAKTKNLENIEMDEISSRSEENVSAILKPIDQLSPVLRKNNSKLKMLLEKDLAQNENFLLHPSKTRLSKDTKIIFKNSITDQEFSQSEMNFNENFLEENVVNDKEEKFLPTLANVSPSFEKFIKKTIFKDSIVQQSFCPLNVPNRNEDKSIFKRVSRVVEDEKVTIEDYSKRKHKLYVSTTGKDSLVFHVSKTEVMVSLDLPRRYLENFNFPSIAYIYEWVALPNVDSRIDPKLARNLDINETRKRISETLDEISQLEELYFFTEKQKQELDKTVYLNKNQIVQELKAKSDLEDNESNEIFSIITDDSDFGKELERKKRCTNCLCSCFRRRSS